MHTTLKGEAIRPPRSTCVTQQRAFNSFRRLYNDERPHEALDDRTPASLYRSSRREYTGVLPPVEYPGHYIVKRVTNAGTIRLKKRLLFIANALVNLLPIFPVAHQRTSSKNSWTSRNRCIRFRSIMTGWVPSPTTTYRLAGAPVSRAKRACDM